MMATTHHEQQQALDLSFGDANTSNRATKDAVIEAVNKEKNL